MDWEHKGVKFTITIEKAGTFVLASARAPREGIFVRVRPFSALGKSEEEALELLQQQIKMEFRRVPE
ncbi:MAG TPA: hypothetical protein VKZ59_03355 [Acidobacteriota bacterium]|nr:hypothetical protein [Acidobacteriota bacterium]